MVAAAHTRRQSDLREHMAARQFFADRLEAHFRAHPNVWISIFELIPIGGPSWGSRIRCDLKIKRGMGIEWNRSNLESAYRFTPHVPLGRDPQTPDLTVWPRPDSPYGEPWRLT